MTIVAIIQSKTAMSSTDGRILSLRPLDQIVNKTTVKISD